MYPDIIAQCVYTTLLHAYPNSWNNFDDNFKSEMCQFIYLWQVGTKPTPSSWKRWELHHLEPSNLPKLKIKGDKQSKPFDFDSLLKEAKEKERRAELELKRIAMQEKRKLALSKRRSCGTSLGRWGHESRMGVAMDQLAKLGPRSVSMAHCPSSAHPLLSPLRDVPLDKMFGEKLAMVKTEATELPPFTQQQQQQRAEESPKEGAVQERTKTPKHIRITNPEGCNMPPDGSCKGVKAGNNSGTSVQGKSAMKESNMSQSNLQQQQQQQQKSAGQSALCRKQDTLMVSSRQSTATSSQQQSSTSSFQLQAKRIASAPISSPMASSRPESSYDSTPIPTHAGGKSRGLSTTNEEYFSFKKMALSLKEKAERESATLQGPAFDHVVFNVYGRSPLVRHYLDNKNLTHVNEKEVVVGRTEISEEQPKDAVCYKDILTESKTAGDANQDQFQRYRAQINGHIHRLHNFFFCRHYKSQRNAIISAEKHRVAANQEHEQ